MVNIQGVLYSGTVIILVMLLAFHIISYVDSVRTEGAQVAMRMRTGELSNIISAVELDMPRALEISTKRALLSAISEVDLRGVGLDDSSVRLRELILNGTIYGTDALWMNQSTLGTWMGRVSTLAAQRGFLLNISVEELAIVPHDSFSIRAHLRWNVTVNDSVGSMMVARNMTTDLLVSIKGLEDPLYLLGTRGLAHRSIYSSPFSVHNTTTLDNAIASGYYFNTSDAPSFLGRLEGNLFPAAKYTAAADGPIGLETFINLEELYSSGVEVRQNQTMIDHLYFNSTNITGLQVNGSSYDWFRIDQQHAETYGLDGLLIPG